MEVANLNRIHYYGKDDSISISVCTNCCILEIRANNLLGSHSNEKSTPRYFSDLRQTLKNFSEKTSRNTLGKSSNAFYARRLLPKSSAQNGTNFGYVLCTLENLSEDSWKTLGRLLGKSSNALYAIRLSTKSSGSLMKSSAQKEYWKILRRLFEDSQKTLRRLSEDSWKTSWERRLLLKSSLITKGLTKTPNKILRRLVKKKVRRLPRSLLDGKHFLQSLRSLLKVFLKSSESLREQIWE
ncbi:hypothetical protein YC2023_024011 [Brassica napus]